MLKSAMTSFAIRRLVKESEVLRGGRFHKAYQIDYDKLILRFAVPRTNLTNDEMSVFFEGEKVDDEDIGISLGIEKGNYIKIDLVIKIGEYVFMTAKQLQEMPREASGYAMTLRKALRNRVLDRIEQVGMDRILFLEFGRYPAEEEPYRLYVELFGDGNVVLVKGDTIEAPFTSRTWSSRTVKRGERFELPPASTDPVDIDVGRMSEVLTGSGDLVRTLIKKASLPPVYSEEVCFRAGLDKNTPLEDIDDSSMARIVEVIKEILSELEGPSGCYLYHVDGEPTLLEPVLLRHVFSSNDPSSILERYGGMREQGGKGVEYYPLISMALQENLYERSIPLPKEEAGLQREGERIGRIIDTQTRALKQRLDEAERYHAIADSIYLEYTRLEELLSSFDRDRYLDDRSTYPDTIRYVHGEKGGPGHIVVAIDTPSGKEEVNLDLSLDINRNAETYYELSKRAKGKIPGIEKGIEDARRKLEALKKKKVEPRPRAVLRRFWFEDFRWCFSSEGVLMIGGRDARSNERLVKKYLREGDRYAHADVKGSPSVIVRIEKGDEPTEETFIEACHLSILNSKAWTSKVGYESAYWVMPEQVSRTPQAGEFLPKGSFMIRGKKNMALKLPMEGAASLLYIEGVPKVMFGPISAVKARCRGTLYRIIPGRSSKDDVAKVISRELGAEIEQVLSVLPPGDMDMSRMVAE
ncbi:MAG: ribosome rescue protein RqcH [Candidatus Thermoplasmatota archaeon]|nr:ribosome rescue protein RqcH [Candidatus Thermoplasmatota archaeon]